MIQRVKRRFRPLFVLWTIFMWGMLMGEFTLGNAVAGALIGTFISFALPLPALPTEKVYFRPLKVANLLLIWAAELLKASVYLTWLSLRPQSPPQSAIIKVPMHVESEFVFVIATSMYNLQPGGTVTDIDLTKREWTVHLLDASSESKIDQEVATIKAFEQRLIDTFENPGSVA